MTLQAVPFRKGRARKPRLSAPHVPGQRSERFWSADDLAVLQMHYETHGPAYCAERLSRAIQRIYAKANALGLKAPRMPDGPRKRHDTADVDAALRELGHTLTARGALTDLADRNNWPRWLVKRRATALGLSNLHRKEPPWTEAEEALLGRVPLHDLSRAAATFRAHGFARTPTSINIRAKRLKISRRYRETLSATKAARILGIDSKTMTTYCLQGLVEAGRRGTQRLPQQGGDAHTISRPALRRFVLDNLERIDIRKVDKFAFVALLVDEPSRSEVTSP